MACLDINSSNQLIVTGEADSACSSYILIDSSQYQQMIETVSLDPAEIAGVFSWAFGTVVFFWYLGFKIGVAKNLIKKI